MKERLQPKIQLTQELVNTSFSYSDICRLLGFEINGNGCRAAKEAVKPFDISHFDPTRHNKLRVKYPEVTKTCPACGKEFQSLRGSPRAKQTCSYSCSNTYFRSGQDNPNWNGGSESFYRKVALEAKPHHCNRCHWDKAVPVLQVHHIDRNRKNNNPENLEILCPTCHMFEHFSSNDGIYKN